MEDWTAVFGMLEVWCVILFGYGCYLLGLKRSERNIRMTAAGMQLRHLYHDFAVAGQQVPESIREGVRGALQRMIPVLAERCYVRKLPMLDMKMRVRYRVGVYVGYPMPVDIAKGTEATAESMNKRDLAIKKN